MSLPIKIGVGAVGLAAVLGAGSILLAGLNVPQWSVFLLAALVVFVLGRVL